MTVDNFPHGFVLSEAAIYAFKCQDVFPDILSFAVAIPDHLKPLFLIPIQVQMASRLARVATRIASRRIADGATPTGDTSDADLFGTKTFVYDDNQPTVPSSEPGSIFDIEDADDITHHQEYDFDQNIQDPTDTSYMSDVDTTQYQEYPYRTKEKPVRHSTTHPVLLIHLALKPEALEPRAPEKIKNNARGCAVQLVSYDKRGRVFTFSVNCGNGPKTVRASMSDIDEVTMSCTCNFWRWNGPEFHAKENKFLLGDPHGSAGPPDVRDPDRKYWLCKHTYAVLKRLDGFVQQVIEENWELDDEQMLKEIDKEWDRLEGAAQVPLEEIEEEDTDIDVDWEEEEPEVDIDVEEDVEAEPAEEELEAEPEPTEEEAEEEAEEEFEEEEEAEEESEEEAEEEQEESDEEAE